MSLSRAVLRLIVLGVSCAISCDKVHMPQEIPQETPSIININTARSNDAQFSFSL